MTAKKDKKETRVGQNHVESRYKFALLSRLSLVSIALTESRIYSQLVSMDR